MQVILVFEVWQTHRWNVLAYTSMIFYVAMFWPRRSLELVVIGSSSHFCAMAKTLKFALSALALVNAHKPRDDVQEAYDQFLKDFGKSYDSVEKQVLGGLDGVQGAEGQ